MPAGSWNLGRLQKIVRKVNLNQSSTIVIRDTSALSNNYFNIKHIPTEFTMGKNLMKIRVNSGNLVDGSKIHFEIIDFDSYAVQYDDSSQELTIVLFNVFSEDFDGEDVGMVSLVQEDVDGIFYSPFEFVLD